MWSGMYIQVYTPLSSIYVPGVVKARIQHFFNGGVSKKYLILFSKEKCSPMPNFVTSLFEFKKFEFSTGGIQTPPPSSLARRSVHG